jgi:hypothetical protein
VRPPRDDPAALSRADADPSSAPAFFVVSVAAALSLPPAGHGRLSKVEEGPDVWVPHVNDGAEETAGLEGICARVEG